MLSNLLTLIKMNLTNNDRGVTVLEYSAIAALILVVAVATIALLGPSVDNAFAAVEAEFTAAGL